MLKVYVVNYIFNMTVEMCHHCVREFKLTFLYHIYFRFREEQCIVFFVSITTFWDLRSGFSVSDRNLNL